MAEASRRSFARGSPRGGAGAGAPPQGLWHRPRLLNLMADLLLLWGAGGLGYALVAWLLARQVFPVQDVILLTPPAQVTTEQLEYAARSSIRGNFFTVDLDDVRGAFEKLPWVRHAEVRRRWPAAIELRLEEHQAVAYWSANDSGETRLVNRQGEIFTASSNARMPSFSGPEGMSADVLGQYGRFSEAVAPMGRQLVGLGLSSRLAWQLKLDDGLVIHLGRDQEKSSLDERLARFVRSFPEAQKHLNVKVVVADLRYPGGFALKPVALPAPVKGKK
ncbi:MAG: cell division protein FtsQ/DivIB [Rhodocyclaceae bacterium]|nr:cell division protein FtsQ/DivIB [Rhodocyclaceae bacterium]